ncbi:MAG: aminotransferase class I/II-fold pyridoxal phosphate-dependent enzyme [Planctomycetota bacterium]|nr:aminotransferase class I/II-fold pyridoxal phosphate-dependent enzyme [Planctomycetota bacterium]
MKLLSPKRNSTQLESPSELAAEQLAHFGINQETEFGQTLLRIVEKMYQTHDDIGQLWEISLKSIHELDYGDRVKRFNAKKFLSFQLAKILDTLQNSFRNSYQSLNLNLSTQTSKGPYPVFDNVSAIFSATPIITRTATYIYACAEWIEDAFRGRDFMLEIYSRLLNPTSICLANHIVDIEAGKFANQYLAWNFNSGMAAIDAVLSHILGRDDILIKSRHIYGGAYQLIHDWYAKNGNLEIAVETFDGYGVSEVEQIFKEVSEKYRDRIESGRNVYLYLESPCNPHGYVLDVPTICQFAHQHGIRVVLDATVGTPFLYRPLQTDDVKARPDFVIHSYTKDLSGTGGVIAGCVIGRNEEMFIPKGECIGEKSWKDTMFWNVYYVKGAFLNADAAYEVMQGMRTLPIRMLRKCINTLILAEFLDAHPQIEVACNALPNDPNFQLAKDHLFLGLPAPLFTTSMGSLPKNAFHRFFDSLSPTFGHMISLGQSNTIVSCPALTTHSELDEDALAAAGMTPTTIRFAVGDEAPLDLIRHIVETSRAAIDPEVPGFSEGFPTIEAVRASAKKHYLAAHGRYIDQQLAETDY